MRLRHSDPSYPLMIISLFFQISRLTLISLPAWPGFKVPLKGTCLCEKLPPEAEPGCGGGWIREGTCALLENRESKAWVGMVEAGALASVSPLCLLHTCLLCPQPRTQLSQCKATYPHGSAAFPARVILVARAFVTVGCKGSCDSVPGVHSSVCHTQARFSETAYFPEKSGGSGGDKWHVSVLFLI